MRKLRTPMALGTNGLGQIDMILVILVHSQASEYSNHEQDIIRQSFSVYLR